jgi:F-type H+-transporting ATPase subunit b
MDQVAAIFKQLGADESAFYQFGIFLIIFLLLKHLFFNKLQFVLELRESKTTKLEEEANKKFHQADKLAEKYNARMIQANFEAQKILQDKKGEALAKSRQEIKQTEKKLNDELEQRRREFIADADTQKASILAASDSVSDDLVKKLV